MSEPPAKPTTVMDQAFLTDDPDAGELILVRHGEQAFPPPGTTDYSQYRDTPLTDRGSRQADAVAKSLSDRPLAAVYCSGMLRARATGQAIASLHGLDATVVDALREVELLRDVEPGKGSLETFGADRMVAARDEFVATRRWTAYPGSETGAELRGRVVPAIDAILDAHPGEVVVVACHGGVINAFACAVLRLEDVDMFFRPAHASVSRVAFKGEQRVLGSLNEVDYLEPADELLSW